MTLEGWGPRKSRGPRGPVLCSRSPSLPSVVAPPKIRIDKLVDKWSGSIEIGVTTHNPNSLEYPATMTNLQSGTSPGQGGGHLPKAEEARVPSGVSASPPGTIMMSGCGILTNGKGTRREYCEFSLDELQVRVGVEPGPLCGAAPFPCAPACAPRSPL